MKIYIPNNSQQTLGGGWTFIRNFQKGMKKLGYDFTFTREAADVILINGASMTDPHEVEEAKKSGKKIVFRVDNIPKKSRNKRARIYNRMKSFGELADKIVYQSNWACDYAGYLVGHPDKASIIYNGVDKEIFFPRFVNGSEYVAFPKTKYLFVQFNRDENKRMPEALYYFHQLWRKNKDISITLLGQFSPELVEAEFDFFDGEDWNYISPVENPERMADLYRAHDVLLFPAFCDAAPNTCLEARACGLKVELVNPVGGTIEMLNPDLDISLDRMYLKYDKLLSEL